MRKRMQAILCAICLLPISAIAHTGVGAMAGFASGFSHPFGGADHMLAMVAVGIWAAQLGCRAMWAVPGAFVAAMMLGGVLDATGIPVPYIEQGILVSVLALGALIAGAIRFHLAVCAIVVGIFAMFHGHAHGAEMPLTSGAASYCWGFVMATALLHGTGMAAGAALRKFSIEKLVRLAGVAIALGGAFLAAI